MTRQINKSALRVAGIYAAVSFSWIAFSDRLASAVAVDHAKLEVFQTAKGLFFVAATSVLLYFFSKRQFKALVAAHTERERDTLASLREKEALLREINHRVKNNLQLIVSLLHLHGREKSGFSAMEQKVRSMALAHELLTSSPDMSTIVAGDYAERLAEALSTSFHRSGATVRGEGDDTVIAADVAVPVGILIAEACSNAEQHGRGPGDRPLSVTVSIRTDGGGLSVTVRDDGRGFPGLEHGLGDEAGGGMGLSLMGAIAEQVHGALTTRNDGGAVVELRVPAKPGSATRATG